MSRLIPEAVLVQADFQSCERAPLLAALEREAKLKLPRALQRADGLLARLTDDGLLLLTGTEGGQEPSLDTHNVDAAVQALAAASRIDINRLDPERQLASFRLAAFDMDSTLIPIECIDELAALVGRSLEVAALTEAAMRGEVPDYDESLRRRVALLATLPEESVQGLIERGIALNPGVEKLTRVFREAGLDLLVLSGGFIPIVSHIAARIKARAFEANTLEIHEGLLNGKLSGRILNAKYKAHYLQCYARAWSVPPGGTIAFGDGANDLLMLAQAGLAVAYRAKPLVAAQADIRLNAAGFDALLEHFVETRSPSLREALAACASL